MVAANHLASDQSTPPGVIPPKTTAMARMTPSHEIIGPDQLWKMPGDRPSVMCGNCATKGHTVREALIASGELQGKKASGKKVPGSQEYEVQVNKSQTVVGKRMGDCGTLAMCARRAEMWHSCCGTPAKVSGEGEEGSGA